jgi:hypothetical protein
MQMLKLFIENAERSASVVPISWCVDRIALDELKKKEVSEPYLLISVYHHDENGVYGRETSRVLVELDKGMEFVEFDRAGKHTIHAAIIWSNSNRWMKKKLLSRYGHSDFNNRMYDYDGDFKTENLRRMEDYDRNVELRVSVKSLENAEASLEVVVGKEFFAPEPSEREKWWVNLWFSNTPFDQCSFRRRRMVAYSIQPFAVLLWVLVITVIRFFFALFSALVGIRYTMWSPIIHPFIQNTSDIYTYGGTDNRGYFRKANNVFFCYADGSSKPLFFRFLHPWFLTVMAGIAYLASRFHIGNWVGSANRFHFWSWVGLVGTIIVLFIGLQHAYSFILKRFAKFFVKAAAQTETQWQAEERERVKSLETKRRAKEAIAKRLELKYATGMFQTITCDGTPLSARVDALPESAPVIQRVYLRVKEYKAKHCKPFARV